MGIKTLVLKNEQGYLMDIYHDRNFYFSKYIHHAYHVDKHMMQKFKDEFFDEIKEHNLRFVEVDITYDEKEII